MAATYQDIGTMAAAISAVSPAWPTHQTGDLGLLFVETSNQTPGATWPPTGWTLIGTPPGTTSEPTKLFVCWKIATSSSESAPTVQDSGDHQIAVIMTVRGAADSSPISDYAQGSQTNSLSVAFPTLTGDEPSGLVICASSRSDDAAGAEFTGWSSAYHTLTERFDNGSAVGNGGGIGIATAILNSSGDFLAGSVNISAAMPGDQSYITFAIGTLAVTAGSGKKSATASCC